MAQRPQLTSFFRNWLPLIRANQMWFHAAHHITRGTGFAGDHAKIYGKIYKDYDDVYDGAAEKAVGLCEESLACPAIVAPAAAQIVIKYSQPCKSTALQIVNSGLNIERNFLGYLETSIVSLRTSGEMSLGLDNYIAGVADRHETFLYFLQQRSKTDLPQ
jgi:DNA-binding ferritin-like protein